MFGAYARAALSVPIAVLLGGILEYALPFFLPLMGSENTMLYRSFDFLTEYGIFLMLLAVGAGVLARAYVESTPGVRG
jgi:hypothetical protein